MSLSCRFEGRLCLVLAAALLQVGWPGPVLAQDSRVDSGDLLVFVRPTRRAPDAPPPAPPELPSPALHLTPLTLQVFISRTTPGGRAHRVRQSVSRTADRVHIAVGGREWLFARNPLDPRRVSAMLVDHARRTIVRHDESDLRNLLGVTGWIDVLMLGLDQGLVSSLEPTGQTRTVAGIRFVKHSTNRPGAAPTEVWLNQDQALPRAFVLNQASGSTRLSVEQLRVGVDAVLLRSPALRFPAYTVVDVADSLERR